MCVVERCHFLSADGDSSGRFSVGVDSGLVTVAKQLDREMQARYTLTVTVTDGSQSANVQVTVDSIKCHADRLLAL